LLTDLSLLLPPGRRADKCESQDIDRERERKRERERERENSARKVTSQISNISCRPRGIQESGPHPLSHRRQGLSSTGENQILHVLLLELGGLGFISSFIMDLQG
jgi:hypothetical protein